MLLEEHRRRVARLLRGERRVTDLDRLFSTLRFSEPSRTSVQEIGHFAAHRAERDSGVSLARANDIQTSAILWHRQLEGNRPPIADLIEAGRANLNIMPEERIRERFGISHQTARQSFNKAVKKYKAGRPLKAREKDVLTTFGLSMMWQFALDDQTLSTDFADLLIQEGALAESDRVEFESVSPFMSLYALSIMHGACLKMADGGTARLRLASSDAEGLLRIKAEIPISGTLKPTTSIVPLFDTSLSANTHCDPGILTTSEDPVPIEIKGNRLVQLC